MDTLYSVDIGCTSAHGDIIVCFKHLLNVCVLLLKAKWLLKSSVRKSITTTIKPKSIKQN